MERAYVPLRLRGPRGDDDPRDQRGAGGTNDPADYEDDHEKWSVPGRHGYRLVLATWEKVTQKPDDLIRELIATMAAR